MSIQSGTSPGAINSAGATAAPGGVTSVFGRAGAVVAVPGDYTSDQVTNASTVPGAEVSDALETLATDIANLDSSDIANVSTVPGATVTNALDSLSSTAVPLSITAPADVTKAAAVVGVGTTAARADHKHDITTAAAVSVATTNTEGTATTLARSDHTHAGVTSAFGRNGVVVAVAGDYTSSQVSNVSTVPGATVTNALDSLSSTAVPLAITAPADVTKSAAVVGVGTTAARADHKHDITTAAAVSVSTTNTEGTATTLARSDHTHAGVTSAFGRNGVVVAVAGDYTSSQVSNVSTVPGATVTNALDSLSSTAVPLSITAPADVTKSAAVVGVGTTAARADHKHDITTAAAVSVSTTNTEGTATTLARSDHTHAGVTSAFGRNGVVVAVAGDYTSSQVSNSSGVTGATVTNALDTLNTSVGTSWTTVADAAAVSLLNITHGVVYINTFRDFAVYRAASAATVDGITVFTALGGVGRWERENVPNQSWSLQTTIFIDASTGNDQYDASSATFTSGFTGPIRTYQEFVRRTGPTYTPNVNQVIQSVGDFTGDFWNQTIIGAIGNNRSLYHVGSLTAQTSVTWSAVTNQNPATNTNAQVTAAWTAASEVDRLVIDQAGNSAYVIEQGAGAGDAVMSSWANVNVTSAGNASTNSGTTNTTNGFTAISYTYATILRSFRLIVIGNRSLVFTDTQLSAEVDSRVFSANASIMFNRCKFVNSTGTSSYCGGALYYNGCHFNFNSAPFGNELFTRAFINGGLARSFLNNGVTSHADVTLRSDVIFTGTGYTLNTQASRVFLDGCCFRKVTGTADLIQFTGNATGRLTARLWGNNNTTTGKVLNLSKGCFLEVNSAAISLITVTTAGGDISIGTLTSGRPFSQTTGLFLTLANLTFALLNTATGSGGWGGSMTDPTLVGAITVI